MRPTETKGTPRCLGRSDTGKARGGAPPPAGHAGRNYQACEIASSPPSSELPRNDDRGSLAELLRHLRSMSFLAMTIAAR